MTDYLLTADLKSQLDSVGLSCGYWNSGKTNLVHLERMSGYLGIPIPQAVLDFLEMGYNEVPLEKEDNNYLIQLSDVDLSTPQYCYWDGSKLTTKALPEPPKQKKAWVWTAMEQSVSKKKTEYMERFHNIPTNHAPFSPFVPATITSCVISCGLNYKYQGCEITVLANSRKLGTFTLPPGKIHAVIETDMVVQPMEQVYMQIRNLSSSTLTDIVFDMYLEEI